MNIVQLGSSFLEFLLILMNNFKKNLVIEKVEICLWRPRKQGNLKNCISQYLKTLLQHQNDLK